VIKKLQPLHVKSQPRANLNCVCLQQANRINWYQLEDDTVVEKAVVPQ